MRLHGRSLAAICVVAGAAVYPSAAAAAGGASIASAPIVAYGQQEFGNTVTDSALGTPQCGGAGDGRSWWRLPVTTADHITIDLAGQTTGDGFFLGVYPSAANDFNFAQSHDYASNFDSSHEADKTELVFDAPYTSIMPTLVSSCDDIGSYSFMAFVVHRMIPSLSVGPASRRGHYTSFTVGLHNPDGTPLSGHGFSEDIQLLWKRHWISGGSRSAPSAFRIHWTPKQRGKSVTVRVRVQSTGYFPVLSRTVGVKGV